MNSLMDLLEQTPFGSYCYAYPHKTAYRPFPEPIPIRRLWTDERRDALFLYLHVPFCPFRCGYCNLFSAASPDSELVDAYLEAIRRQAGQVRRSLGEASFAQLAIGGGTPTFLGVSRLERLLALARDVMGVASPTIPMSVEASPTTITDEKLALLRGFGVSRLSLGVQSFDDRELNELGRRQTRDAVDHAIDGARNTGFSTLNIDLIYGIPGQTVSSWLASVRSALVHRPEELYLYPLYVRPCTALEGTQRECRDRRLDFYRAARELLLDVGYEQISLRLFRSPTAPASGGTSYCCQEDGMVGLGCGARSYTRSTHYSDEYAVRRTRVLAVLRDYIKRDAATFSAAWRGYHLDDEDQRRRYVIKSLLTAEGLDRSDYARWFGTDPLEDLPELHELESARLVVLTDETIRLNPAGLERSDAIGPFLYSRNVRRLLQEYRSC